MNHNALIIAADVSMARLFRMAQTNDVARRIELVEVASVNAVNAVNAVGAEDRASSEEGEDEIVRFARRVAKRAAAFGAHHVCNPVLVVGSQALGPVMLRELEQELPNTYIRPVQCEVAGLTPPQILERLENYVALEPTAYSRRSS